MIALYATIRIVIWIVWLCFWLVVGPALIAVRVVSALLEGTSRATAGAAEALEQRPALAAQEPIRAEKPSRWERPLSKRRRAYAREVLRRGRTP